MPDDLTLAALQTLSDLKRQGVIPAVRSCCRHDYCICGDAPHAHSLRDYAADTDAFDAAINEPARLHVLTMAPDPPCEQTMTCQCPACEQERSVFLRRGPIGAGHAQFRVKTRRAA